MTEENGPESLTRPRAGLFLAAGGRPGSLKSGLDGRRIT